MVNIDDIYLVMSTVAILHEIPETKNINIKDFEAFLSPPIIAVASLPASMSITSQRDQTEILIANNKTDFRDLSGRKDFSSSNVGKLVEYFAGKFQLKVNTYGINFILNVPHSEPRKWIMENILSSEISKKTGKKLLGGNGTISLKSGRKTWNIGFESTEDNKIGVNFNATEKSDRVPSAEELRNELNKQWNSLIKCFSDLGL